MRNNTMYNSTNLLVQTSFKLRLFNFEISTSKLSIDMDVFSLAKVNGGTNGEKFFSKWTDPDFSAFVSLFNGGDVSAKIHFNGACLPMSSWAIQDFQNFWDKVLSKWDAGVEQIAISEAVDKFKSQIEKWRETQRANSDPDSLLEEELVRSRSGLLRLLRFLIVESGYSRVQWLKDGAGEVEKLSVFPPGAQMVDFGVMLRRDLNFQRLELGSQLTEGEAVMGLRMACGIITILDEINFRQRWKLTKLETFNYWQVPLKCTYTCLLYTSPSPRD